LRLSKTKKLLMNFSRKLIFFSALLFISFQSYSQSFSVSQILTQTFDRISKISSLKYTFTNFERINGKLLDGKMIIKMQSKPRKVYAYMEKPSTGSQVLFVEGANDGNVLYIPTSFPYLNLNLDPYGSLLRDKNHHTIHKVGFDHISKILSNAYKRFPSSFKLMGDTVWKKRSCYVIKAEFSDYKIVDYKMIAGQNLMEIARIKNLSEYKLLELNNLSDYSFLKVGQTIKIPTVYAKKIIMFIDKQNFLPIFQKIYDEKSLFEQYEFTDIQVNPVINSLEFTEKFIDKN